MYQPARLDRQVSVEDTVRALVGLLKEGKFDHIGLSECSAASLRRGHAVSNPGTKTATSSLSNDAAGPPDLHR